MAQLVGFLATMCRLHPAQEALLHLVNLATPEVGQGQAGAALRHLHLVIDGNSEREGAFKQWDACWEIIATYQQIPHDPMGHRLQASIPELSGQF